MSVINKELLSRIKHIEISTRKVVEELLAGAWRSAFKGQGLEFEEVREYLPGDDIRTIDWNVTARLNKPFVKSFREERQMTVMLLVDVSTSCKYGSEKRLKSELVAELSAALAFSAIKNQDKVGILLFSNIIELYIPPRQGRQHVLRLIREILAFKPKGRKTDIKAALRFLGHLQKRSTLTFLISDFLSDDEYINELKVTKNKHDLVLLAVRDPLEKRFPKYSYISMQDMESGEIKEMDLSHVQIEDDLIILKDKMKRLGIDFLEFSTAKPYSYTISQFFKERSKN